MEIKFAYGAFTRLNSYKMQNKAITQNTNYTDMTYIYITYILHM